MFSPEAFARYERAKELISLKSTQADMREAVLYSLGVFEGILNGAEENGESFAAATAQLALEKVLDFLNGERPFGSPQI